MTDEEVLARLKGRSLFLGGPCYSARLHVTHVANLISAVNLLTKCGVNVHLHWTSQCSRISMARCQWFAEFVASGCDYGLTIDSDVAFDAHAVPKLMLADKPFIGAVTVVRGTEKLCITNVEGSAPNTFAVDPETGLLAVNQVGTAFCMYRRDMALQMEKAYPNLKIYRSGMEETALEHLFAFYSELLEEGCLMGEDYSFSTRWRRIGGEIWVDPTVELFHFGEERRGGRLIDKLVPPPDDQIPADAATEALREWQEKVGRVAKEAREAFALDKAAA